MKTAKSMGIKVKSFLLYEKTKENYIWTIVEKINDDGTVFVSDQDGEEYTITNLERIGRIDNELADLQ